MFRNVNLSNLENVLQGNLRIDRAKECIFGASEGTNFENFSTQSQPWWPLHGFNVCTGLPKKNSGFVTELDFKDIKFPVKIRDIHKIEKNNLIGISVLGYEDKKNIQSMSQKML